MREDGLQVVSRSGHHPFPGLVDPDLVRPDTGDRVHGDQEPVRSDAEETPGHNSDESNARLRPVDQKLVDRADGVPVAVVHGPAADVFPRIVQRQVHLAQRLEDTSHRLVHWHLLASRLIRRAA
jgi:hypothetical protein